MTEEAYRMEYEAGFVEAASTTSCRILSVHVLSRVSWKAI